MCRVTTNLQRALSERHRPSKELLLQPLPLELPDFGGGSSSAGGAGSVGSNSSTAGRGARRSMSLVATSNSGAGRCNESRDGSSNSTTGDGAAALAPLPSGGVPRGVAPVLPAACPATPSGALRKQAQGGGLFGERTSPITTASVAGCSAASGATAGAVRAAGSVAGNGTRASCLSHAGGCGSGGLRASSSSTCGALLSPSAAAAVLERPRDAQGGYVQLAQIHQRP